MRELAADCDQVVAAAAMIGGISYFHEFAYDLLAENERILASTFDAAIAAHRDGHLERIVVVSSVDGLRVGDRLPDAGGRAADLAAAGLDLRLPEARVGVLRAGRRRSSTSCPYTIVRPFNCVGIGERRALRDTDIMSGNVKLALSHVVPDLVLKVLKGQDPLHILGDGHAGPALHVRRRPGPRHPARDGVARRRSTTTSTSRPRPRRPSSSWPRPSGARSTARRPAVPLPSATRRSSTTSSCASPTSARRARSSASRRRPRSTRCSTRSSRGSRRKSRPAGCDQLPARAVRGSLRRARGEPEGRGLARDRRVPRAVHRPRCPGARPRLRPGPLHPVRERPGAMGDRHPGRLRVPAARGPLRAGARERARPGAADRALRHRLHEQLPRAPRVRRGRHRAAAGRRRP